MRQLKLLRAAIDEGDHDRAKVLIEELIEDTQKNIED